MQVKSILNIFTLKIFKIVIIKYYNLLLSEVGVHNDYKLGLSNYY